MGSCCSTRELQLDISIGCFFFRTIIQLGGRNLWAWKTYHDCEVLPQWKNACLEFGWRDEKRGVNTIYEFCIIMHLFHNLWLKPTSTTYSVYPQKKVWFKVLHWRLGLGLRLDLSHVGSSLSGRCYPSIRPGLYTTAAWSVDHHGEDQELGV